MNKDQMEGKWNQLKGSVKEQWGKLTDDDLDQIAGKSETLVGKLQERYGLAKEEAQKSADAWMAKQKEEAELRSDLKEAKRPFDKAS